MLKKAVNHPLRKFIIQKRALNKIENEAYKSCFLTMVREKMINEYSKGEVNRNEIYEKIYQEANLLLTEEQMVTSNHDFLEQSYNIFSSIHKLVRNCELIYDLNQEESKIKFNNTDPNSFPISNNTFVYKSLNDYDSIYNINANFNKDFIDLLGFNLVLKKSTIYHQDSGEGVFLVSKNKFILPGTLLGFYPGVVYSKFNELPNVLNKNDVFPYLKRKDLSYVDPLKLVPYPNYDCKSYEEFIDLKESTSKTNGKLNYIEIPLDKICPLSMGVKINHPPPDVEANVAFLDFEVPYDFFPSKFLRYLPNFNYSKSNKSFKIVGIVSLKEINNGDELFVDYIDEELVPYSFKPDWLLKPPPNSPYLTKQEHPKYY